MSGEDTSSYHGYLQALRKTRVRFKHLGGTATDHGHPTVRTADLPPEEAALLFHLVVDGRAHAGQQELFRAQMLTEMAGMSVADGLVMQIHPGTRGATITARSTSTMDADAGADIPTATDYVHALRPLLDRYGNESGFTLILFTLDESTYSRELAPLAGHYPCLRLGPPWWFHDSPRACSAFVNWLPKRRAFYNTAGFNDDTRAFLSIPARHDVARRMDAAFLAKLVVEHRIDEDEAFDLALELTDKLVRSAYKL